MKFLYEHFENSFAKKALKDLVLPKSVSENLKFEIREY